MGRCRRSAENPTLLGIALVFFLGVPRAWPHDHESVQIGIVVCDSSRLPPGVLAAAEREASRIFIKVGIEVDWLECSPQHVADAKDVEQGIACHRPRGPERAVMEILPEPAPAAGIPTQIGGFARLTRDGSPAYCAGVFYDRADSWAHWGDASTDQILAHLMAHEIGHLLLSERSHSRGGLMQRAWSRNDLRRAAWGRLSFDPGQLEKIREGARGAGSSSAGAPLSPP